MSFSKPTLPPAVQHSVSKNHTGHVIIDGDRRAIIFHVENLSPADAQFLGNVISYFADPAREDIAKAIRAGQWGIHYTGHGLAAAVPIVQLNQGN